jgi:SAM-dependent methyltransferase
MASRLTKREFLRVVNEYPPSRYDGFEEADARFVRRMHHALKCRERLFVALRSGLGRLNGSDSTILDFGPYPGTLLRLIRTLCLRRDLRLIGAGLMTSDEFIRFMKQDCHADILTVNLDPSSQQFREKAYPEQVPVPDGSVHLSFALEIVEHLTSPYHLLTEAFRVLAPGGHLVVTTPNVTRIGNIFKLLIGRTPNDRLAPPGYDNPDDEWRPHAREYAMEELARIVTEVGFEVAERRFFLGEDTQDCVRSIRQRCIDLAKTPFYAIPHYRGSLLLVGRKPS